MKNRAKFVFLSLAGSAAMTGCSPGGRPFYIATSCVVDDNGLTETEKIARELSKEYELKFSDISSDTARGISQLGNESNTIHPKGRTLMLSSYAKDGMGVSISNVGLPTHQIAAGFNYGRNKDKGEALKRAFVARLRMRWEVIDVPPGQGALPLPGCD